MVNSFFNFNINHDNVLLIEINPFKLRHLWNNSSKLTLRIMVTQKSLQQACLLKALKTVKNNKLSRYLVFVVHVFFPIQVLDQHVPVYRVHEIFQFRLSKYILQFICFALEIL